MNPATPAPLYDAHNHLQDAWLAPHRPRLFADLLAAGVRACVVNGTSEADWPEVAALGSAASDSPLSSLGSQLTLHPSYGLHPWDAGNRTPDWQHNLLAHLAAPSAKVGEIGLDRWILDRARPDDPRLTGLRRAPLDEQIEVFRWQLILAAERNLPASIHCLDAFGPLLDTLRTTPLPARGFLLHAYSGPADLVKTFAALGAYFSFNGAFLPPGPPNPVCHPSDDKSGFHPSDPKDEGHTIDDIPKKHFRRLAAFRVVPADRLLVETDAPAMRLPPAHEKFPPLSAPDGSLANHPANLGVAYAGLAAWRGLSPADLAARVERNFLRLFGG